MSHKTVRKKGLIS